MFVRSSDGVYRSEALSALPWLRHGFGSRHSADWPGEYTQLKQIHSNTVILAPACGGCLGSGDALVTNEPGHLIGIRTADCVPMLLADTRRQVVAAIHAGWRGTVANIAGSAITKMTDAFGTEARDLIIAIGPCIGSCCFEVGSEVAQQFGDASARTIDLAGVNRCQLADAGVELSRIDISGICTMCSADFHSWRRDRENAGRMVAAIGIWP